VELSLKIGQDLRVKWRPAVILLVYGPVRERRDKRVVIGKANLFHLIE
jgi:hypothetical protein